MEIDWSKSEEEIRKLYSNETQYILGIHRWVKKNKVKPVGCEKCSKKNCYLELSNTNHTYKKRLSDWKWVCKKCHAKRDGVAKLFKGKCLEEMYGTQKAQRIKEELSKANKGKKLSKRHKEILRMTHLGFLNPMKNPRIAQKAGNSKKGKTPWNKGLTKEIDERVAKLARSMLGNKNGRKVDKKNEN